MLTAAVSDAKVEAHTPFRAMSEEQLSALLAKLRDDSALREKLKGVRELEEAVVLAKEAGFDVNKADWLQYQAKQTLELSDEQLESVAGGELTIWRCQRQESIVDICGCAGTTMGNV